jgi:transcriptional regulator with GAF, ATPase, and Fis domain
VLVLGESGTGKEKIANLIHQLSDRAAGTFVAINCAAIPSALAESTLFGHKKGAFSGATSDQPGKFETADGGTLFLDEIAELPLEVQAKLLRALQDGVIEPLGFAKAKKVNVRVIAATNRDLNAMIANRRFREDLYYRLSVGEVRLPTLRERRSDISKLAIHFLDEINVRLRKPRRFAPETLALLQGYDWPGNVRELQNAVQRAALLTKGEEIRPDHFELRSAARPAAMDQLPEPREGFSIEAFLKDARRRLFKRALDLSGGNQSKAARLLGVTPQAVFKFLKGGDR